MSVFILKGGVMGIAKGEIVRAVGNPNTLSVSGVVMILAPVTVINAIVVLMIIFAIYRDSFVFIAPFTIFQKDFALVVIRPPVRGPIGIVKSPRVAPVNIGSAERFPIFMPVTKRVYIWHKSVRPAVGIYSPFIASVDRPVRQRDFSHPALLVVFVGMAVGASPDFHCMFRRGCFRIYAVYE